MIFPRCYQVYRLNARLKSQGPARLARGNRGRKPAYTIPDDIREPARMFSLRRRPLRHYIKNFLLSMYCRV